MDSLSWTPGSFSQCICLWDENDCMGKRICGNLVLKLLFVCVCMCVQVCRFVHHSGNVEVRGHLKELVLS